MSYPQCPWCFETVSRLIPGENVHCHLCKHRLDVPREECDCRQCQVGKAVYSALFSKTDLPSPPSPELFAASGDLADLPDLHDQPQEQEEYGRLIERTIECDGSGRHPGDVSVSGRHLTAPIIDVQVTTDYVRIRIDDRNQPEQWVEVMIFDEALAKWWRLMCEAHPDDQREQELDDE